jgi:hypothetical protein
LSEHQQSRDIDLHYDVEDLEDDVETLRKPGAKAARSKDWIGR